MKPEPDSGVPVTFRIDGRKIKSIKDFYREIGRSVNGPGGYFGRISMRWPIACGADSAPQKDRPYEFEWEHSAVSRRFLADVRPGQRPFFDSVRDVFDDAGVTLKLK